ncbi:MAG: class I SAM-dependent methyltransferase [Sulfolobales archaeon]
MGESSEESSSILRAVQRGDHVYLADEKVFIYDLIADRYEDLILFKSFFYFNHYREIARFLYEHVLKVLREDSVIADIGCGTGFWSLLFKRLGYKVVGLDLSKKSVEISFSRGVDSVVGEASHVGFRRESFDLVVALASVINHMKNPKNFFRDVYYILKPGGYLVFDFDSAWALDNLYEAIIYRNNSREILTSILKLKILERGFDIEWNFGGIEIRVFTPIEIIRYLKIYDMELLRIEPIHILPGIVPVRILERVSSKSLKRVITAMYKIDYFIKKILSIPIPLAVSYIVLAKKRY